MANYLITGAAGFIGARVSEMALDQGHTVLGLDNLNDAYDLRLKQWRLNRLLGRKGFTFLKLDIADRLALNAGLEEAHPDAVINLAARAGVRSSVEIPWAYVESNTNGTLNLLEFCRRRGVPKFVLASTSSLYGANPPLPTPETAESDHPLQPYAASKKGAESLAYSYHYLFGLDVTVFRFFTVYGPAGRPDMVMFRFCQWIAEGRPVRVTGDGNQSRGFTYVDDIAAGALLGLKPLGFELINLGGHETISINAMIAVLERKLGRKAIVEFIQRNPADVQENWANVEKARRLLGWQPRVGLDEGIGRMVDWYLAERAWASQIATP